MRRRICVWPESDETLLLLFDDVEIEAGLVLGVVVPDGPLVFGFRSDSFGSLGNCANAAVEKIKNVIVIAMNLDLRLFMCFSLLQVKIYFVSSAFTFSLWACNSALICFASRALTGSLTSVE